MTTPDTVYGCIVGVAGELAQAGISKTRSNSQQGYKFRGIDDVFNALAPLLAKYRLVILPRVLARTVVERASRNGGVLFSVTVEVEFDFVSAADGSRHTVKTYGEAMDSADKATNKAMSAAYKYAALQTFCIPTEGGDHEADAVTPEPVPMPVKVAAPTDHPSGYLAWFDTLRAAAMLGTPALERAWFNAPKEFRQHVTVTAPGAMGDLKLIAGRLAGAGNGRAS